MKLSWPPLRSNPLLVFAVEDVAALETPTKGITNKAHVTHGLIQKFYHRDAKYRYFRSIRMALVTHVRKRGSFDSSIHL